MGAPTTVPSPGWQEQPDPALRDHIAAQVSARRARAHLIVGPSGMGKSTMLLAVGKRLAESGHPVIRIVGDAALQGMPLAALAPLLTGAADADPAQRLQRLFDTFAPARANHVLLVDDAHLLDAESGAIVTQVVRLYGIRAVLAAPSAQALGDSAARLAEDGIVETTLLPRLDQAAAAAAVERALGGRVDPDDLRALLGRAGGNPLHLRELVMAIVRDGSAERSPHGLLLRSGALPARLRRSIAHRYAELGTDARHYAELLAIAQSLPAPVEPADVEAADELETAGLVRRQAGVQRLAEPLHREILLALLSTAQREERAREAAARLSTSDEPGSRRRAIELLARTSVPPSSAELEWASTEAHSNEEHALAIELADVAIGLAEGRGEVISARTLLARANALSMAGRATEAEAAFAEVLAMPIDDDDLALGASRLGFHHAVRRMNPADGARRAEELRGRLRDPDAIAFLDTTVAKLRFMGGVQPTTPQPPAADDGAQELNVQLMRILHSVFTGELAVARDAIGRVRALADAHSERLPQASSSADFGEFLVLVDEARAEAAHSHVLAVKGKHEKESAGLWSYAEALLALLRGDVDAAHRSAAEASELLAWRDYIGAQGPAHALCATAAAMLGHAAQAREILAVIDAGGWRANVPTRLQSAEAEAWLLAAAGDRDAAEAVIASAVRDGLDARYATFSALTAITALRLDRADAVLPLLRDAAVIAPDAPLVHHAAAHVQALASRDPAGLLACATAYEAAGFAAAAVDAARQSLEIARSQGLASVVRRARLVSTRLGAALPAGRDDPATVLSAREYAVASAAAARLRNREIAQRLGISVRTVENHLARAFRKLGATSRDELASLMD